MIAAVTLNRVCGAAAAAAPVIAAASSSVRARLLERIAARLDEDQRALVAQAREETHLTVTRLVSELNRTTDQLRSFSQQLTGIAFAAVLDHPDGFGELRKVRVPVGPVAVFAASNFPFAFSVAGGDTASALAAGCPVIVKVHSGHPKLSLMVADHVKAAVRSLSLPTGVFDIVGGRAIGALLVQHPAVAAVGFTGSTDGGRALFDLAATRPNPIPFFGELGSVNPAYVTREAADARLEAIAEGFVGSFTLSAGQFCTKPGLIFVPDGDDFTQVAAAALEGAPTMQMLTERIRDGYMALEPVYEDHPGIRTVHRTPDDSGLVGPSLYATSLDVFLDDLLRLRDERFGPSALVVEYTDVQELQGIPGAIGGTLTSTFHAEAWSDRDLAPLVAEATRYSGRLVWNGWPTGVAVSPAMTHGGPYPASTAPSSTSVGADAIDRFLRPVTFQGFPQDARTRPYACGGAGW
jgi:NADP-dependent aldehyde dehydrogenase